MRGFTLIEIIIAVFLIGSIFMLYEAAFQTTPVTTHAAYQDLALKIAASELETLRGAGYAALPASGASFTDATMSALANATGTLAISTYNPKTAEVTATVSWTEPEQAALQSLSLTTLITQIGGLP